MDIIKTWSPILIPILGLLAGTGWLQYYLKVRSEKQGRHQAYLDGFLNSFTGILTTTKSIFVKLRDNRELVNLEYHPGRLQQYFSSLDDGDARKLLWKSYIELLQKENQDALHLIDRYYGQITVLEFKEACDKFKLHVKEWELVWKALQGSGAVPDSLNISGALFAPQFPDGLEDALQAEIAAVKKLTGLK